MESDSDSSSENTYNLNEGTFHSHFFIRVLERLPSV